MKKADSRAKESGVKAKGAQPQEAVAGPKSDLLRLQQGAGNRAVNALLVQRKQDAWGDEAEYDWWGAPEETPAKEAEAATPGPAGESPGLITEEGLDEPGQESRLEILARIMMENQGGGL